MHIHLLPLQGSPHEDKQEDTEDPLTFCLDPGPQEKLTVSRDNIVLEITENRYYEGARTQRTPLSPQGIKSPSNYFAEPEQHHPDHT